MLRPFKSLLEEPVPPHREKLAEGEMDVLLLPMFHQSSCQNVGLVKAKISSTFIPCHNHMHSHIHLAQTCAVWGS